MEEIVDKRGLAGAYFARDDNKALVFGYCIFKVCECIVVSLAHEEIIRVRVKVKGLFFQPIKRFIHKVMFNF
ncbi:hypothetical protein PITCH_A1720010 [uncultured Desulfobacterium sp.]|uniref:Uncharacterized protein n=1 Tax=uncultured Desulfobacterium sp. TaxID=201089 RepID=A0A445MUN2_9BACT|nr:hypothetical protein PITCH_A1720010 [uncultured Desulfobacterium sp.]